MHIRNIHQRQLRANPQDAAFLLDGLSSSEDRLWPAESWPRIRFDRLLQSGAVGGHGPIRYMVTRYVPGQLIAFQFTAPRGFHGTHWFEVLPAGASGTILRHTIDMRIAGAAMLSWPIIFRPLHDALVEDALTKAQVALGDDPTPVPWSGWVRLLRRVLSRRRKPAQDRHPRST